MIENAPKVKINLCTADPDHRADCIAMTLRMPQVSCPCRPRTTETPGKQETP